MKKGKLGMLALIGLASMGAPSMAAPTVSQYESRDAVADIKKTPQPVMQIRNAFGGFGNASHKASRYLNQRQYRKLVRQNPHLKNSQKHRSKN